MKVFDEDGEFTETLTVTDTAYGSELKPTVAGLKSGGFVVAWM